MIYDIFHSTEFNYHQWVNSSHNLIRLQPRNTPFQTLLDYTLETSPFTSNIDEYFDYFGNRLSHINIREPHSQLKVVARSCVALDREAITRHLESIKKIKAMTYEDFLFQMGEHGSATIKAKQYALPSPLLKKPSIAITDYVQESFSLNRSLYESIEEFMGRIFDDFTFQSGFSDISTPINEVFKSKKGVCQDFSHLAIAALRSLGLCVRYVSGYIETLPPEGEEKLFGVDATHAWFSVYFPGYGWYDFDPTNNLIPALQHIVLGYGRDYSDIAPTQGVIIGSGSSDLRVMVNVSREDN